MNTEELELLLEAQTERPNLDFKQDCSWEVTRFAKHLLAMSNLKDGGYIIIGVENTNFQRQGVSQKNLDTFKIDIMRDQMTKYADPFVDFEVYKPKGKDKKDYVAMRILPFKEIPVICRKDDNNAGLKAGVIYYRNSNRRIESAPISNSNDMKDLIQLATIKMMKNMNELGLTIESDDKEKLDQELQGL